LRLHMKQLDPQEFLSLGEKLPIIDVRSPVEYEQGRLPNALNMPLLSDEERVIVGTLYKQDSPQAAFKRGLDFIGPKMSGFIEFAEGLQSQELLVHCWRGGNRSHSVAMLLETNGFNVSILNGGYKAYRREALEFFDQPLPLMVLTGYTGSLKTEVLYALQELGEQMVDFEGLACHQGSAFGRQESEEQPTSEQFQNLLFQEFRKLDLTRRIWVEDESMRIGRVDLVAELYHQKEQSPHVFLEVARPVRVKNLVLNYRHVSLERLVLATKSIQKKLGKKEARQALEFIDHGDAPEAAAIILKYYDKRYGKAIEEKREHIRLHLETQSSDPMHIAEEILSKI
jgi:tRNA 2-selenouridine synthase